VYVCVCVCVCQGRGVNAALAVPGPPAEKMCESGFALGIVGSASHSEPVRWV